MSVHVFLVLAKDLGLILEIILETISCIETILLS